MSFVIPPDFKEDSQLFLDENDAENTDIFLIRIPKRFDIKRLHGAEFSASEIKEIEIEEGTNQLTAVYELGTFSGQGLDVSPLILSGHASTLGTLKGFVSVNKSCGANHSNSLGSRKVEPAAPVAMPKGLKVRFKPFGAGTPFKQPSLVTKKKKRKRKNYLDISSSSPTQDILQVEKRQKIQDEMETHGVHKKHKKHKHKKKIK